MNYVTTNIRISEEDYLRLKAEAAKKRKSLSGVIREKIKGKQAMRSKAAVHKLVTKNDKLSERLGKKLKDFDIVRALREMRYEGKW